MGVPGMVGELKNNFHKYGRDYLLKNTNLVIDATHLPQWLRYHETQLHPNDFGANMVQYEQFWTNFMKTLILCNVKIKIVYDGAPLNERKYGPVPSKSNFLRKSSDGRLAQLRRNGAGLSHYILPSLALPIFKKVASSFGPAIEQFQATHESYPLVAELANRFGCPVLTNHSDFLLTDVYGGMIWSDKFDVKRFQNESIPCHLFEHTRFIRGRNLERGVTTVLYALLRPDFNLKHSVVIARLIPNFANQRKARCKLESVLQWLANKSLFQIKSLLSNCGDGEFMKDFESIYMSYTEVIPFERTLPDPYNQLSNALLAKLKNGQADASLFMEIIGNTHFERCSIEDIRTTRSTFSMQDTIRSMLLRIVSTRLSSRDSMSIYDRQRDSMRLRELRDIDDFFGNEIEQTDLLEDSNTEDNVRKLFFKAFRINEENYINLLAKFRPMFNDEICELFATIVLLIGYAHSDAYRGDNSPESLGYTRDLFRTILLAFQSCFLYYGKQNSTLDSTLIEVINGRRHDVDIELAPSIRVLEGLIDSRGFTTCRSSNKRGDKFMNIKHILEQLNSVIAGYYDCSNVLKSGHLFQRLGQCYNANLIYNLVIYSYTVQSGKSCLVSDTANFIDIVLPPN